MPELREVVEPFLIWFLLAVLLGIPPLCRWSSMGRMETCFLPSQRQRAVPWSGLEILLAALSYFAIPAFMTALLYASGLFRVIYGIKRVDPEDHLMIARCSLWAIVASFPLQTTLILSIVARGSGTLPYQVGWTSHRAKDNVTLGYLAWVVAMPVILGFNILVETVYHNLLELPPEPHVFQQLAQAGLSAAEWTLLALSAVVAAPVLEELLFRGLLQRYFGQRKWGGDLAMVLALAFSVLMRQPGIVEAIGKNDMHELTLELQPALFVGLMLPVYLLLRSFCRSPRWPTIYGTGLLFAAVHSTAWPQPIPLFLLAIVLGWLAWRTQSLVGPIVLHGLFNSVAVFTLLIESLFPKG